MFSFLASQSWVRPGLFALSAIAQVVKLLTPSYTIAHRIADWVTAGSLSLGAGSVGMSNSTITPDMADKIPLGTPVGTTTKG